VKFLADMGVSKSTVRMLREQGHDVVHLGEEGLGRLPDSAVLEKATKEGRIVLTFDLDFGDLLAACTACLASVVIFRMRNQTPASLNSRLLQILSECERALAQGIVVIVEDARYRLRRFPIRETGDLS